MVDRKDTKREYERAVFNTFLTACPTFAARVLAVEQGRVDSHVDVMTKLKDGTRMAWQLAEWIEQKQIEAAKERERLKAKILEAIGEQGPNTTKHIRHCTLSLRQPDKDRKEELPRFDRRDAARLKTEIDRLISDVDSRWERNLSWQSPQGYSCTAFHEYSTLGKYLDIVHFEPRVVRYARREWPHGQPWIHFGAPGGPYDSTVAIDALKRRIRKKAEHYGTFGSEDVRLIVFYNQAVLHNTPFWDLTLRSFEHVASIAKEIIARIPVPFTKVYLLKALYPAPEAFEVYPTLRRCD